MPANISTDQHIKLVQEKGIQKFLELIEFLPIGITISDNEGNIIESNKEGARLLGLAEHTSPADHDWQVIRKDCSIISPEEYPLMKALRDNIRVENVELGIVKKNEITWLNITATPLPAGEGVLVAYVDISDNIRREIELERLNYKLKDIIESRDKFFRILAHDLKNPFNSIFGFCDLIHENMPSLSKDEIDSYIGIIQSTAGKTHELLENLLEWSRSQSGSLEFKPEYNNVASLINDVISFSISLANQKNIKIIFENPEDSIAYFDKNMIQTVLRNLITNAIKYSYPDSIVKINYFDNKGHITVSIADTGIGIEKDKLEDIFNNYDGNSLPGTLNEKGSGFGLSICKDFIEKHKGTIWVESEIGMGSKFFFKIPKNIHH